MGSLPLWATSFSCGMWDLVPRTGIKPRPPALRVWSLGHWTIRKFHKYNFNTLLLPWTRSAEHQSCLTPTLCIPQLNTGEKSHNRTDGFYFKSYDDKTQTLSTVQQAYCISWSNLHPTWEHYCTLLSSNFPRTVPLDPQPLSFPHVLPIDEKCKGPLNDMGLNCKGPLVSDFFFTRYRLQYCTIHSSLNLWIPNCIIKFDYVTLLSEWLLWYSEWNPNSTLCATRHRMIWRLPNPPMSSPASLPPPTSATLAF